MDSNLRFQLRILSALGLCIAILGSVPAQAQSESEAYRRQAKFEIERATDFRHFQKRLAEIDRERMTGVPSYKTKHVEYEKQYESSRAEYSVLRKREDAKKPTDEYVEKMLAEEAKKEERAKEQDRKQFRALQLEIERAIANSRLNEAEEYGL